MLCRFSLFALLIFSWGLFSSPLFASPSMEETFVLSIDAYDNVDRTDIASTGIAIEEIFEDYVIGIGSQREIDALDRLEFDYYLEELPAFIEDFPPDDSLFHNLEEVDNELQTVAEDFSDIAELIEIGQSVNGLPLKIMRISGPSNADGDMPGIIFLATHHAREHLSTEVPLYLIKYLVENYGTDETVTRLLDTREIWIMPLVNPDGAEYDVRDDQDGGPYRWWRKNRRGENGDVYGVDLNRNYGYKWGGKGAGKSRSSQTYMGPSEFSEPETQAIRDFLIEQDNINILLSYHTFSELILYPWGYTYDSIEDDVDLGIHETMAKEMGKMTGYRPQQSSDLYITSGDTTDWSYGELGIISFTFELYPSSIFGGGFYPSANKIQSVVDNNIPPALYLIEHADNPERVLDFEFTSMMTVNPYRPLGG